jgi:hypothetical protein
LIISSCNPPPPSEESKVYPAGAQVSIGPLTWNVVDSRILPRLGKDSATARFPQERFYLLQITVSNAGDTDASVPALALVDDSGKVYNELTDGSGVQDWLGLVRNVKAHDQAKGAILFDAPASHYRLRLTERYASPEISIDLPLNLSPEPSQ